MKCSCGITPKGNICLCGKVLYEIKVKELKTLKRSVKPIKKVSKKMGKTLSKYTIEKKKFIALNPNCAVFPWLASEDIHHKKGKIGSLYLDTRYWLAVSRAGHLEITNNPAWAIEMGYSLQRLKTTI
jgi:hypothetical protein